MSKRWYIVHAYSNFEKKVAESIRDRADLMNLADKFDEVLVPTEQVVEVRRGRKVNSERKFFPGYVLVKCDLTDEVFHLIKNTEKVTGFLGSGSKPIPIPDAEAARASFISHQWDDLDRARVAELKEGGLDVLCWTIRSPEAAERALRVAQNITFEGYLPALPA